MILKTGLEFSQKDIDDLKPSLLKLQELGSAIEEIQDDLGPVQTPYFS